MPGHLYKSEIRLGLIQTPVAHRAESPAHLTCFHQEEQTVCGPTNMSLLKEWTRDENYNKIIFAREYGGIHSQRLLSGQNRRHRYQAPSPDLRYTLGKGIYGTGS